MVSRARHKVDTRKPLETGLFRGVSAEKGLQPIWSAVNSVPGTNMI
jgi:hypothetical protein